MGPLPRSQDPSILPILYKNKHKHFPSQIKTPAGFSPAPEMHCIPFPLWGLTQVNLIFLLLTLDCLPLVFISPENTLAFNNCQIRQPLWLPFLSWGEFLAFLPL